MKTGEGKPSSVLPSLFRYACGTIERDSKAGVLFSANTGIYVLAAVLAAAVAVALTASAPHSLYLFQWIA
jgi:hypothetical protein